jgi:excisionase family DNA binding protein
VSGLFIHKEDVAKRLGVTPRTVGIWAAQDKLPAYRFGRFLRFKWAEVEQALAKNFRVVLADGHHSDSTASQLKTVSTPHPKPNDSIAPAHSALGGPSPAANSFHRFPSGGSPQRGEGMKHRRGV